MNNKKYLYIDHLLQNIEQFGDKKICAMVKANAYGHGIKEIVKAVSAKVDMFGVVNIEEAKSVRSLCDKPILICSKTTDYKSCKRYGIDVMIEDEEDAQKCYKLGITDSMNLKINCGMNRFGSDSFLGLKMLNDFLEDKNIKLRSIYTHFPYTEKKHQTKCAYKHFCELTSQIRQSPPLSFGGSGIYKYPFDYDILRLGIGMYGYEKKDLLPVMEITSTVIKTFFARKGEFIGYGNAYKVTKDGYFAVVGMGYADGLCRNLSGKFKVKINGRSYEAVGNICMDCFFVKVDEQVTVGDTAVVMQNAETFASTLKTIPYEILTNFNSLRGKTILIKK